MSTVMTPGRARLSRDHKKSGGAQRPPHILYSAFRILYSLAMRVVITGGAGFLGSHLSDLFLSRGHEVVAVDNLVTGSEKNIAHLKGRPDFEFRNANVSE